ncbi:MAG: murein hydrolase transporter LrgA [Burkholderiales bacterium RIFCSPHIGHO2_12_FULL_61_11]|nr:MAG: murein hydrolase transporter LrgA [Burkholderiales bacterium RIFCSPHIGHO2_12_FULL_61_11]
MQALRGLTWLLVLQSLGELIARGLSLPLPGPVIGMLLLLVALRWTPVRESVALCADFLLSHLSLLFVPVGVGVMTHLSLVSQYGLRMLAVVFVSTLLGLGVTVLSLHLLRDRRETDEPHKDAPHA